MLETGKALQYSLCSAMLFLEKVDYSVIPLFRIPPFLSPKFPIHFLWRSLFTQAFQVPKLINWWLKLDKFFVPIHIIGYNSFFGIEKSLFFLSVVRVKVCDCSLCEIYNKRCKCGNHSTSNLTVAFR